MPKPVTDTLRLLDGGAVKFTYEMNRADVVHERAAKDVITTVQAGIGETPMLMGAFD